MSIKRPRDDTSEQPVGTDTSRQEKPSPDADDSPVPSEQSLQRLFDLTPAEIRLAQALTAGDSLQEVAYALGIKMSTARTQLASIFAKTDTRRQTKLVALLNRLAQFPAKDEQ